MFAHQQPSLYHKSSIMRSCGLNRFCHSLRHSSAIRASRNIITTRSQELEGALAKAEEYAKLAAGRKWTGIVTGRQMIDEIALNDFTRLCCGMQLPTRMLQHPSARSAVPMRI